jgi:putative ABC transport system permease protein
MINQPDEFKIMNLKITKGYAQHIIPVIETAWKNIYPFQPIELNWFDKVLKEHHSQSDDITFIGLLTMMAFSIACLGLLGMVIYSTKNRMKEISIRRLLGGKTGQIMLFMSREFIILLVLSVCIGVPVGIYAGNAFLQQYAYHISIGIKILSISIFTLFGLGSLTIGIQTYRTVITNPAKTLRIE